MTAITYDDYLRRYRDKRRDRLRDVASQLGRTYGAVRKRAHLITCEIV